MKVGPRYKICKRLGNSVFEKCQTQKFTLSESRRSTRGRGRRPGAMSDYGKQLLEKQRVRYTYGMTEKQLARYVRKVSTKKGVEPAAELLSMLESRLDNVAFRLGLAPTRRAARQMVSHGHILVNGKRITIPSFHVEAGDAVTVRDKSKDSPLFKKEGEDTTALPTWLEFDEKKLAGTVKSVPTRDAVDLPYDLTVVLEYYSR